MNLILIIAIAIALFYYISSGLTKKNINTLSFEEAKYLVSLLAKVAKSDGRVNELEANLISEILNDLTFKISGSNAHREELRRIYNVEKENLKNTFSLAFEYKTRFNLNIQTVISRIYFFLNIAYIDGNFSKPEQDVISQICDGFEIDERLKGEIFFRFERAFWARNGGQRYQENHQNRKQDNSYKNPSTRSLKDPYEILGLKRGATGEDVRNRYRELVKKYHPDILMGKGADDEIVEAGTKKLQEINEAYEEIKKMEGK